jgi:uncharacterized protein YcbX
MRLVSLASFAPPPTVRIVSRSRYIDDARTPPERNCAHSRVLAWANRRKQSVDPVGRVVEIWRYAVSSLGGERLREARVSSRGVAGDRQYALIDAGSGLPAAPETDKRWRNALHLQAKCLHGHIPVIAFPDGDSCALTDPSLNSLLSGYFGFPASVATYRDGEGRPELPPVRHRYQLSPMHLLTTASIKQLAALRHVEAIDSRRFRPTVLIEARQDSGFIESEWVGRRLRLGAVGLTARGETRRCGMTVISQPGLAEDAEILRSILWHNNRNLGIYCSVDSSGTIALGDELVIES